MVMSLWMMLNYQHTLY